jgi:hypothetical protein
MGVTAGFFRIKPYPFKEFTDAAVFFFPGSASVAGTKIVQGFRKSLPHGHPGIERAV